MAKIIKEVSLPGVVVPEKFVIAVFDTREEAIEKISDFKKFMIGEDVVSIGDGAIMLYSKGKTISYSVEDQKGWRQNDIFSNNHPVYYWVYDYYADLLYGRGYTQDFSSRNGDRNLHHFPDGILGHGIFDQEGRQELLIIGEKDMGNTEETMVFYLNCNRQALSMFHFPCCKENYKIFESINRKIEDLKKSMNIRSELV